MTEKNRSPVGISLIEERHSRPPRKNRPLNIAIMCPGMGKRGSIDINTKITGNQITMPEGGKHTKDKKPPGVEFCVTKVSVEKGPGEGFEQR